MMREAARALDDVSDHLGEVLRRADDLLVEWSKFGAQVRGQVEREAGAIGQVVEGAVGRVAAQGIDRAIGDRLRALTLELERLEQRTRVASRAVVEQREADRRILWAVVAGIVLANALLVVLLLRKPAAAPVVEPVRMESTSPPSAVADPAQGSAAAASPTSTESTESAGSAAPSSGSAAPAGVSGTNAPGSAAVGDPGAGHGGGPQGAGPQGSGVTPGAGGKATAGSGAAHPPDTAAPRPSPVAIPPRPGTARSHKKLP